MGEEEKATKPFSSIHSAHTIDIVKKHNLQKIEIGFLDHKCHTSIFNMLRKGIFNLRLWVLYCI